MSGKLEEATLYFCLVPAGAGGLVAWFWSISIWMLTAVGSEVEGSLRLGLWHSACVRGSLEEVKRHKECSLGNCSLGHCRGHSWLLCHLLIGRGDLRLLVEVATSLGPLDLDDINDRSLLVHFHDSTGVSEDLHDGLSSGILDFETTSGLLDCYSLMSDNWKECLSLFRRDLHIRALIALNSVTIIWVITVELVAETLRGGVRRGIHLNIIISPILICFYTAMTPEFHTSGQAILGIWQTFHDFALSLRDRYSSMR